MVKVTIYGVSDHGLTMNSQVICLFGWLLQEHFIVVKPNERRTDRRSDGRLNNTSVWFLKMFLYLVKDCWENMRKEADRSYCRLELVVPCLFVLDVVGFVGCCC